VISLSTFVYVTYYRILESKTKGPHHIHSLRSSCFIKTSAFNIAGNVDLLWSWNSRSKAYLVTLTGIQDTPAREVARNHLSCILSFALIGQHQNKRFYVTEIVLPLKFTGAIFWREKSDDRKCVCCSQATHNLANDNIGHISRLWPAWICLKVFFYYTDFFKWKILHCFPKHKINKWNLIANYYSFCSWRDQSLKVIFGVTASGFCPFLLQFYSLITTGAFTTVMSTKLHLLHRCKNVLSQSKETHLWSSYHEVFIEEHLRLGGNFILNFVPPIF